MRRKIIGVAWIVPLWLVVAVSPARASVTIGQTSPSGNTCSGLVDSVQPTVTSGNSYVVPATVVAGTLTSWSTPANAGGGMLGMKVYRRVAELRYMVVGHDGPHALAGGVLNTFPTSIAVTAGDVLGLSTPVAPGGPACIFSAPGDPHLEHNGNLADGESGDFAQYYNIRLNVSAVVTPTNAFTLGGVKLNRNKGTATISANVPNPGTLTGSGKGVKVASAALAIASKDVKPGTAKLTIRAKGKKARKLDETGKVKVTPKISFTPTGGKPSSQPVKVKLRKR